MHPTMEQILGSLVGSGSSLPSVAQCVSVEKGESVVEEEAEEEADMMQVLGGIDEKVKDTAQETTCSLEKGPDPVVDKEESEKRLQQLKLRQSQLEDRFTSLNRRIQALRTFKYGSHVAQQLCRLRKMGKKNANPEGSRLHMSQIEGHLKFLLSSQEGLDSEATESSSGGESCDEMESFPAHNLQYLPIQKRAKWTWLKNRASLASKWTWLTAQISDLEFKIRQQTELYRQIRAAKAPVLLEKPYRRTEKAEREIRTLHNMGRKIVIKEPLCPPEREEEEAMGASRTRPVKPFVRRKVLSTKNLYRSSPQAAKECTVRCHCLLPDRWCAICYGKKNTARVPSREGRDSPQSIALLDHSYHHVISSKSQDVSLDLHMMTKIKNRSWLTAKESSQTVPATLSVKKEISTEERVKKPIKKKKKAPADHLDDPLAESSSPLQSSKSVKKKKKSDKSRRRSLTLGYDASLHDYCTDDMDDIDSSPLPSPSISGDPNNRTWIEHVKRRRESAYDIDNIVIPYSIAASTRVERIKYKEIITPTWRVVQEEEEFEMKDLLSRSKSGNNSIDNTEETMEDEDVSQMAYEIRHRKAELEEQRRWKALPWKQTGGQRVRSRRQDSKTDLGSGCNTPDPLSPGMVDALEVSTRPSTPLSVTDETPQSIRERRRTTSSTKLRDRLDENTVAQSPRSTTPNSIDQAPCVVDTVLDKPPFEARTFPISETEYEKMAADMPVPRVSTNNYSQPETQSPKDDEEEEEEEEEEEREVLDTSSCESKKPSQTQSISSEKIPSTTTTNTGNNKKFNNINNNSNSSCEASSDEDGDFVMEDDLDWNGDDPNDPEWGESQSKSEH